MNKQSKFKGSKGAKSGGFSRNHNGTNRKSINSCPTDKDMTGIPKENDWEFYAASEQIAKDIASLPFNYMGGTKFPLSVTRNTATPTTSDGPGSLPAVMGIHYTTSVGVTNSATQAINMAAVQTYTYIRHQNSGAKNYEAADVTMYLLAMGDIYSEFFELKKIYGIAGLYNYYNHNLPDAILHNQRINATDLRSNLAAYRGRLNLIAKKINSFAVPKYYKAFARRAYIASYLFTDSTSIRSQMYQFIREGYYKWSGTASTSGTSLVFTAYPKQHMNFSQRLDILESMIDALFLDEDALTMSGDILKAYGDNELYTVAETSESYTTSVLFDENILAQIENMICLCPAINQQDRVEYHLDITQSDQIILYEPRCIYTDVKLSNANAQTITVNSPILNSHKDNPDYKDVLEWSRLMTTSNITFDEDTGATVSVTSCGLELPLYFTISQYEEDMGQYMLFTTKGCNYLVTTTSTQIYTVWDLIKLISLTSEFDWHPFIYTCHHNSPSYPIGDVKVATTVPQSTLKQINDAAIYGAFFANKFYGNK